MHRVLLRRLAREAMAGTARYYDIPAMRSWSQAVNFEELPIWGVMTPDEQSAPVAKDYTGRSVVLSVAVKREGGDELEDELDVDAAEIEAAVLPVLLNYCMEQGQEAHVSNTAMRFDGDGMRRVGVVEVRFACGLITETPPAAAPMED